MLEFPGSPHEDWSRWIPRLAAGISGSHNPIRLVAAPDSGLVWTTPSRNLGLPKLWNRITGCILNA